MRTTLKTSILSSQKTGYKWRTHRCCTLCYVVGSPKCTIRNTGKYANPGLSIWTTQGTPSTILDTYISVFSLNRNLPSSVTLCFKGIFHHWEPYERILRGLMPESSKQIRCVTGLAVWLGIAPGQTMRAEFQIHRSLQGGTRPNPVRTRSLKRRSSVWHILVLPYSWLRRQDFDKIVVPLLRRWADMLSLQPSTG